MRISFVALVSVCAAVSSCVKTNDTPRPVPKLEGAPVKTEQGEVKVTVRNIKSEKDAWFQNCLSFEASTKKEPTVVGCNKRKPNTAFLEAETPVSFPVTKGEKVSLKFFFDTWYSTSKCITWDSCSNPYPNPPVRTLITKENPSILCAKSGTKFRIFFEDQPSENIAADTSIRSRLVLDGTNSPAKSFDPAHRTDINQYQIKPGSALNPKNMLEKCVLDKMQGTNKVSETVLLDCLGIDHADLVVDIEPTDANIEIEGISENNCMPI
jgi:hypothetical protein